MQRMFANVRQFSAEDLQERQYLAEGTLSTVDSASLHGLQVAVKTLKPLDAISEPLTRQRALSDFDNELAVNITLRHPNIVLLLGYIRTPARDSRDTACDTAVTQLQSLVFEHCADGKLRCASYGPGRLAPALHVAICIGSALSFAHGVGVVHRDVKPSQVVFCDNVPKLADWGLAAFCTDSSCTTGETGTWEFMAPEVIRHEPHGPPVDVYSFTVLFYCLLTGEDYPYGSRYLTPSQAVTGVVKRDLRPRVPDRLEAPLRQLLTMGWANDPSSRPDMATLLHMLVEAERRERLRQQKKEEEVERRRRESTGLSALFWGLGKQQEKNGDDNDGENAPNA